MDLTPDWRKKRPHRYTWFDGWTEQLMPPAMPLSFEGDEHRLGMIYLIICKPTGMAYVGQSKEAKKRWSQHRMHLRRGSHHSPRLQKEWSEHGEASFMFAIVERRVDMVFLHCREQFWMWRFEGRLLNASSQAHSDRCNSIRMGALKAYTDAELIAEMQRRGLYAHSARQPAP